MAIKLNSIGEGHFKRTSTQEMGRFHLFSLLLVYKIEPSPFILEVKEIAKHFRPRYKGSLIVNYGFRAESGKQVIEEGYADAVAFGKPFIANPDLVERIAQGAKWNRWDEATFYTPGAKGYTDYPTLKDNGFQDAPQDRQDHGRDGQNAVRVETLRMTGFDQDEAMLKLRKIAGECKALIADRAAKSAVG